MNRHVRAAIIHGAYGTAEENWFPWLAAQLNAQGVAARVPTFPTPEGQTPEAWRAVFAREIGNTDSELVLIGHSLGAGFVLNLLEAAPTPVMGSFLASAFVGPLGLPDFDSINAPFVEREFNWSRIKRNAGVVHVYHGDNDPYVPLTRGELIARNLGAHLSVVKGGGHFNASAGYLTFPKLLEDVLQVIRTSKAP